MNKQVAGRRPFSLREGATALCLMKSTLIPTLLLLPVDLSFITGRRQTHLLVDASGINVEDDEISQAGRYVSLWSLHQQRDVKT